MEFAGTPIDVATLALLREYWGHIQDDLIAAIDADYGVFESRTFKADRWEQFSNRAQNSLAALGERPVDLSDEAFRQMAKAYPSVSPMRELRSALSDLRLNDLAVGAGRTQSHASCRRSERAPVGTSPATPSSYSVHSVWLRGTDPTTIRLRLSLYRLGATRIRHCSRIVRRSRHAGRLSIGRPIFGFRQASRRGPTGCHQTNARDDARAFQGSAC